MQSKKNLKTNSKEWTDIFRSDRGEKLSSSQIWFNIANLCVTTMYILLGVAVYHSTDPNIMDYGIFTAIYAGIVTGNKVASRFLSYRYSAQENERDREYNRHTDHGRNNTRRGRSDEDFDKNLMEIHKRKVINRDDDCMGNS
jgi:hypothetical protein